MNTRVTHTPKSLLALTKSPGGLEQLRIIVAEFDGWSFDPENRTFRKGREVLSLEFVDLEEFGVIYEIDNYPTSLDAIFAAEKRLGLHDFNNYDMRVFWYHQADRLSSIQSGIQLESHDMAFVSILDRCICFILTAQWKEQNK